MANLWLDALLDEKVALDPTVLEWIERYEEDETAAMTEMVNFILRVIRPNYLAYVSVVDAPLKSAQKTSMSKTTSLTTSLKSKKPTNRCLLFSILLTFKTNPREYPLIATKKTLYRKFPKRLQEFFRRLLQKFSAKG